MIGVLIQTQIARLGIRFEARDVAPADFETLRRECTPSRLVVWAGASDATIYGDPAVNWAFRAWHDATHLALNAPFTLDGERACARAQAAQIGDVAGSVVWAEIVGQAEYFAAFGTYPVDQTRFVVEYLRNGGRVTPGMRQ